MLISYFFPYLRRGLGAVIAPGSAGAEKRAAVNIDLTMNAQADGGASPPTPRSIRRKVALYGPGDVLGFDANRMIVRSHPTPDDGNFIENNLPFVEFAEPDFLWRYSAAQVGGKWIPWLTLITLKMDDSGVEGEFSRDPRPRPGLPPRIRLRPGAVLPDLSDSWRWAHVQCNDLKGKTAEELKEKIRRQPGFAISRLLCARRLSPGVKYCAFVVPAYRLGVEDALGIEDTGVLRTHLAWEGPNASGDLAFPHGLPYFHQWEFRTGRRGDFEQLVRKIKPRPLRDLGGQPVNVDNPGYGLRNTSGRPRELELVGALQSSDSNDAGAAAGNPLTPEETQKLARLLSLAEATDDRGRPVPDVDGKPKLLLTPPIYGRWINHAEQTDVNLAPDKIYREWLETVNLDLRYRIAAGLGARYVRENQEELMQSAWTQLENIQKTNRTLNLAQFGREISTRFHRRLAAVASDDAYLSLTAPVNSKLTVRDDVTGRAAGPRLTVSEFLRAGPLPNTLTNPKFRKYLRIEPGTGPADFPSLVTLTNPVIVPLTVGAQRLTPSVRKVIPAFSWVPPKKEEIAVLRKSVSDQLDPVRTIQERLTARLGGLRAWEQRRRTAVVRTPEDPLRPVMFFPEFHAPMYKYLRELSAEYFLPGANRLPQNTVSAALSNRPFIEAFMLGLNHEFASELRWRGYPTDLRGSYFRSFWETTIYSVDERERVLFRSSPPGIQLLRTLGKTAADWPAIERSYLELTDERIAGAYEAAVEEWLSTREEDKDIIPLDKWKKQCALGTHRRLPPAGKACNDPAAGNEAVILIRAELLRAYPNTFIYLVHKTKLANINDPESQVEPIFEANLPPDIVCLGFPFPEAKAREHYLVFEERLSELRYGLELTDFPPPHLTDVANLSWQHFQVVEPGSYLNDTPPEPADKKITDGWKASSPYIAVALTQKQLRVVVDLNTLLP